MSPRAPCTMGHWVTRKVDDSHIACAVPTPRAHTCTGEIISGRVVGAKRWPGVAVLTWCHLAGSGIYHHLCCELVHGNRRRRVAIVDVGRIKLHDLTPMRCEACNVRRGGHYQPVIGQIVVGGVSGRCVFSRGGAACSLRRWCAWLAVRVDRNMLLFKSSQACLSVSFLQSAWAKKPHGKGRKGHSVCSEGV